MPKKIMLLRLRTHSHQSYQVSLKPVSLPRTIQCCKCSLKQENSGRLENRLLWRLWCESKADQDMNQMQEMKQGVVKENKTNQKCTTASPSAHTELPLMKHMCSGIAPFVFCSGELSSRRGPASIPGSVIQKSGFFFLLLFYLLFIGIYQCINTT